jgi:nucleoside diphosphate kinase
MPCPLMTLAVLHGQEALRVWRQVIEATELGHHKPRGEIRLSFGASFSGDADARA